MYLPSLVVGSFVTHCDLAIDHFLRGVCHLAAPFVTYFVLFSRTVGEHSIEAHSDTLLLVWTFKSTEAATYLDSFK